MSLIQWEKGTPHQKADEPSRVDEAIAKDAADAANERRWKAEIDLRDGRECRACGRKSDPELVGLTKRGHRHHMVYASAGGSDEPCNRVTLCYACHNDEHKNRLRIDGPTAPLDANGPLVFMRKGADGQWFISREEIAVRVVRKD
jgi:hypothetical protein